MKIHLIMSFRLHAAFHGVSLNFVNIKTFVAGSVISVTLGAITFSLTFVSRIYF